MHDHVRASVHTHVAAMLDVHVNNNGDWITLCVCCISDNAKPSWHQKCFLEKMELKDEKTDPLPMLLDNFEVHEEA